MVTPKSTVKLNEGDFSWVKREDGLFTPFVFISKVQNKRSYLYGGFVNFVGSKCSELPTNLNIEKYALLHIETYIKNDLSIDGNLLANLSDGTLDKIKKSTLDLSIGSKSKVWGYKTIYKYANEIECLTRNSTRTKNSWLLLLRRLF